LLVPRPHLHLGPELHDRLGFALYNSVFMKSVVFDFTLPHSHANAREPLNVPFTAAAINKFAPLRLTLVTTGCKSTPG
jgi:hypothetical protein